MFNYHAYGFVFILVIKCIIKEKTYQSPLGNWKLMPFGRSAHSMLINCHLNSHLDSLYNLPTVLGSRFNSFLCSYCCSLCFPLFFFFAFYVGFFGGFRGVFLSLAFICLIYHHRKCWSVLSSVSFRARSFFYYFLSFFFLFGQARLLTHIPPGPPPQWPLQFGLPCEHSVFFFFFDFFNFFGCSAVAFRLINICYTFLLLLPNRMWFWHFSWLAYAFCTSCCWLRGDCNSSFRNAFAAH